MEIQQNNDLNEQLIFTKAEREALNVLYQYLDIDIPFVHRKQNPIMALVKKLVNKVHYRHEPPIQYDYITKLQTIAKKQGQQIDDSYFKAVSRVLSKS